HGADNSASAAAGGKLFSAQPNVRRIRLSIFSRATNAPLLQPETIGLQYRKDGAKISAQTVAHRTDNSASAAAGGKLFSAQPNARRIRLSVFLSRRKRSAFATGNYRTIEHFSPNELPIPSTTTAASAGFISKANLHGRNFANVLSRAEFLQKTSSRFQRCGINFFLAA
ncbi:MAG: hypothetical protein DBX55_03460, partial [Verrucomicrobia bacterium]